MEDNYTKFATIKVEIDKLKKQEDEIKEIIMADMLDSGEEKVEKPVGKFSITKLKKWTYTPKVAELNEQFKAQKAHEESTGEATYVEAPSLRFTKVSI